MSRWLVTSTRQHPTSGVLTVYQAMVSAADAFGAVTALGDRIRAGDLAGVEIVGEHHPAGADGWLNLVASDAVRLPDDPPRTPVVCGCHHTPDRHVDGTGRCRAPDSYGVPCTCPAYEEEDIG